MEHKHLIVRAECLLTPNENQCQRIEDWFRELIDILGMKVMYGPVAKYCFMPGNRGMTCMALIETSHIVLHTWDEIYPFLIQLDIYTCSSLDVEKLLYAIDKEFWPNKMSWKFLDRENDLVVVQEGN